MLIELADARRHLVLIHDLDDELITDYINAAQDYIEQYIGRSIPWMDGGNPPEQVPVPESLKQAARLLVGDSYALREASVTGTIHSDNPAVMRLLNPYRVTWGV
ncbi:head-tail connector protein [Stenotrophomonas nematodicola]|uniref:head-tail connector protein n=1 Tax=Stenotrophomonas nematodicola TaxID=2656746 RepID=UPI0012914AE8|nr:head-tail connector protein [Stenotrophomonas nematodicola]